MIKLALAAVLTLSLLIVFLSVSKRYGYFPPATWPWSPKVTLEKKPEAIILNQLHLLKELTTSIHGSVAIVSTIEKRTLAGLKLGSTELIYMGVGKTRVGIDLSQLTTDRVQIDGSSVSIELPRVQVLDVTLDVDRSKVLKVDRTVILAPWGDSLQTVAEREALAQMRKTAADESWVREAVEEHTMDVLRVLLKTVGVEDIHLEWHTADG